MGLPGVTEAYMTGAHRTGERFRATLALLLKRYVHIAFIMLN